MVKKKAHLHQQLAQKDLRSLRQLRVDDELDRLELIPLVLAVCRIRVAIDAQREMFEHADAEGDLRTDWQIQPADDDGVVARGRESCLTTRPARC